MLKKLENYPEVKRALGIAAGIFVGLVCYRLFRSATEWWSLSDDGQKQEVVALACGVALLAFIVWLFMKFKGKARASFSAKKFRSDTIEILENPLVGVRGWLLFLCFSLTVIVPVDNLSHVETTGTGGSILLIISILLSVFSIFAGAGIWVVSPYAVTRCVAFLWTVLTWSLLNLTMLILTKKPIFQSDNQPSNYVFAALYAGVWLTYLKRSRRVKFTFGLT